MTAIPNDPRMEQTASVMTRRTRSFEARCLSLATWSITYCVRNWHLEFPFRTCTRLVDHTVGGLYLPVICNRGSPSGRGVANSIGYVGLIRHPWTHVGKVGRNGGRCLLLNVLIARGVPLERLNASDRVKVESDAEIAVGAIVVTERG